MDEVCGYVNGERKRDRGMGVMVFGHASGLLAFMHGRIGYGISILGHVRWVLRKEEDWPAGLVSSLTGPSDWGLLWASI